MNFEEILGTSSDISGWGCVSHGFTFCISYEHGDGYRASAKPLGALPFDETRYDIGRIHTTLADAQRACEDFCRRNRQ